LRRGGDLCGQGEFLSLLPPHPNQSALQLYTPFRAGLYLEFNKE